jgi:hypothetical protein
MGILGRFERQGSVVEMMLFAYAVGVASFTTVHMPVLAFGAAALLVVSYLLSAYSFWWLSRPDSPIRYLFYGLLLAGTVAVAVVLYAFATEITAFTILQQQNSVTMQRLQEHHASLWFLLLLHTVASAVVTLVFYLLYQPQKRNILRVFALSWASMPVLFLVMKLYALVLPMVSHAGMMVVLFCWIAATGIIGYGAFLLTESKKFVAAFVALTVFIPPVGVFAFALFIFLRILMPSFSETSAAAGREAALSPQYARQLNAAQAALKQQLDALDAAETALRRADPKSPGVKDKIQMLEKEKAVLEMKKITAEEAYERLQRMQR